MLEPPPAPATRQAVALFLDFDGTLVDIAERPDDVALTAETHATLIRLRDALDGAVAIVTGRDIGVIDAMLSPLVLPVAGVHGLVRRDAAGRVSSRPAPQILFAAAERIISPFVAEHPELIVERKTAAIALHYRRRPELEAACIAAMERLALVVPGTNLIRGKMVVEAKETGTDKGTAVVDFMGEPPFAGRVPVFAGDDATDEDAFLAVNGMGGLTIKIGNGASAARWRLPNRAALLSWLQKLATS